MEKHIKSNRKRITLMIVVSFRSLFASFRFISTPLIARRYYYYYCMLLYRSSMLLTRVRQYYYAWCGSTWRHPNDTQNEEKHSFLMEIQWYLHVQLCCGLCRFRNGEFWHTKYCARDVQQKRLLRNGENNRCQFSISPSQSEICNH